MSNVKTCSKCFEVKDISQFYTSGQYFRAECKPCTKLIQAAGRFGLSIKQLEDLYRDQGYVCAICKQSCSTHENLSVDHDHACCGAKGKSCGKCVRGLLCSNCNHGLGAFKDDPVRLQAAIAYLTA